jgi:PAS domain S-box-containing protein
VAEAKIKLHAELENRIRFETLISDISARFVRLPSDEIDSEIERNLKQIMDFFDVDRCGVLEVHKDKQSLHVTHACYAEGIEQVSKNINLAQLFPWAYEKLIVKGVPVRLNRMTELPPEAEQDRLSWSAMGVKSSLTIPLFCTQGVRYVLTIQSLMNEHDWPKEFVPRLTLLGEIFINALERRNADQALGESESRLNLAADSAEAGLWMLDISTGVFWVTAKTRDLLGFPSDNEITFEYFMKGVHPDDREQVRHAVDHAGQSKEKTSVQYRIVRPDGNIRWMLSHGRIHSGACEETNRLMGVSIDITERIRAEEAFRSSEARLEAGADLAGLGYYEVDFEAPSCFVGTRFGEICGIPSGKQQGLQNLEFWMEHLHPDDRRRIFEERTKLHEGMIKRIDIEYRYLHPTAGQKWIHHVARVAKRNPAGQTVLSYGVIQDITERKQLTERIQAAAKEWQRTFDTIGDFMMLLDPEYRIVRVNKSAEVFWGLPLEKILGSHCHALMNMTNLPFEGCPAMAAMKTKQAKEAEVYLDSKNIWLAVSITPMFDDQGRIAGFIHSARDITERKRMEEEIRRIRDEYTHIARVSAMGELTASLAHELKQPLAAIRSNAQAALRFLTGSKPDIDELHEVLKDIIADNRRADEVIGRLRMSMRKSKPQIIEFDIKELVRDLLPLVNSHEAMRKISLDLELDETIPAVAGDRIQIQQVILNLILNSTEALMGTKKQSRLIVVQAYQQEPGTVTVSVRDNGPGIETESMPHLFEAFYTTKPEGLGMGLAICRSIVEEHRGQLWAENNPDGGAAFYFTIPTVWEDPV